MYCAFERALPLKRVEDAVAVRNHIIMGNKVDLVATASRGRSGLRHLVVGSVSAAAVLFVDTKAAAGGRLRMFGRADWRKTKDDKAVSSCSRKSDWDDREGG